MKETMVKVRAFLLLGVLFISSAAFKEAEVFSGPISKLSGPISLKKENVKTHETKSLDTKNLFEQEVRSGVIILGSRYLGMGYRSGGKAPSSGFDCSGFTSYLLSNFDINVSSSSHSQIFNGKYKPLKDVEPGDLVFFARSPKGRIFHVAMVKENTEEGIIVIHSTCSNGVIESNISTDGYWAPKIVEARDVIGS